jgi:hypothetical protein
LNPCPIQRGLNLALKGLEYPLHLPISMCGVLGPVSSKTMPKPLLLHSSFKAFFYLGLDFLILSFKNQVCYLFSERALLVEEVAPTIICAVIKYLSPELGTSNTFTFNGTNVDTKSFSRISTIFTSFKLSKQFPIVGFSCYPSYFFLLTNIRFRQISDTNPFLVFRTLSKDNIAEPFDRRMIMASFPFKQSSEKNLIS